MLRSTSARSIRTVLSMVLMLVVLSGLAGAAHAEPTVTRTTPLDGEVLQRTPTAVGIGFDESLDQEASSFRLLNRDGSDVEGTSISWGTDGTSVTMNLPSGFPDGVYTVVWHAVSASDGSVTEGWSSFSVGNPEDANIITIPTSSSGHEGPPTWVQSGARFIALFGLACSISIWPIWRGIIRPALVRDRASAKSTTRAVQRWATIAIGIAFIGSIIELVVHSQSVRDAGLIDGVMQTLGRDEWGFWWLTRTALLAILGIAMAVSPWWNTSRHAFNSFVLWSISFILPFTLVLSGHAMDDSVGRITTVASQYLLYLTLSLLLGGAICLALFLRTIEATPALAEARRRFIWLVITAGSIALLTGIYLADIFAGNWGAITETAFGNALLAQAILAGLAVIIAIVLLVRSTIGKSGSLLAMALSVVLAGTLLATGTMDVLTPARAELTERSVQTREDMLFDGRPGIFLVAPGRAGVNHWRLETPGTYLQTETQVYAELSSPDYPEIGSKEVQLYRVQGNAFEHHGTEFSLIGDWQITVRIEEPGFEPSTATFTQYFGEENTTVQLPAAPLKFKNLAGIAGLILAAVAAMGIATTAIAGKSPLRKEAGGLTLVAVGLAAVVILQGQIDPLLVVESGEGAINPNDLVMVQRGEEAYMTYCASCHGVGLRGDGPLAESLNPPPVDFSQPHTKVHNDADLIYWIQYGIQGTAMPGFKSQLEDQDIRDIISFIYWWQQDDGASFNAGTPEAEVELGVCEVTPLSFADLTAVFNHGLHPETRRGTPLVRAADSEVPPNVTNEVMWTIEQMVNCANQDQFLSQIRLFTQPMLQDIFPQGASYEVTTRATSPSQPVAPEDAISIQDVQSVNYLADGRIAVTVIFNDPAGIGVVPGANPVYQVTLIFVQEDGVWYIDEVR